MTPKCRGSKNAKDKRFGSTHARLGFVGDSNDCSEMTTESLALKNQSSAWAPLHLQ